MTQPLPSPDDAARLVVHAWITAFNAGDLSAIVALYHPQAVLWGTTSPALIDSADGIRAYFAQVFALRPAPQMAVGDMRVRRFGDTAIASGRYDLTLAVDGTARTLPARFSFTCRLETGAWSVVDHHSSWVPAALTGTAATAAPPVAGAVRS